MTTTLIPTTDEDGRKRKGNRDDVDTNADDDDDDEENVSLAFAYCQPRWKSSIVPLLAMLLSFVLLCLSP